VRICAYFSKYEKGVSFDCSILPDETAFYSISEKISSPEINGFMLKQAGA
jgi:hypothetical protein